MSAGKRFVLDTNVFIQAHRTYYGFDICPGFWLALLRQHRAERVYSIDKVRDELLQGRDELSAWAKNTAPTSLFNATSDHPVAEAFTDMVNWVQNEQQYTQPAKAEFSSVADGWLVAYSRAYDMIVVTHEEYAPAARKKVPIPNLCVEFGVDYKDTFEMLRCVKERFVLDKRQQKR